MKNKSQAIDVSAAFIKGEDLFEGESRILTNIIKLTGFVAQKNIWRSRYWGKNLGASHWLGILDGDQAVLKIQGTKPDISEYLMIEKFNKSNNSNLIRPPKIIKYLSWNSQNGYEAIFMEYINGDKVLEDKVLQTSENISRFFSYYREYREKCIPKKAWTPKPKKENWTIVLDRLVSSSMKAFPTHPFRESSDFVLAKNAYEILERTYESIQLEFLHGHFSCNDLIFEGTDNKKSVLFSNLFWKWRFPYFDAVFAYHWFIYELNHVDGITPGKIEEQRGLWTKEIFKATGADKSEQVRRWVNAALLERAVAGLIIDSFLVDHKKPIAKYLTDASRQEVVRLSKLLAV